MNILILTTHLNKGGISRYVINLASSLVDRGNKVWLASSGGEWASRAKDSGIEHINIPIKTKSILSPKIILSFFKLYKFVQRERISIIQSNTRVTQFLGFIFYKSLKIPYVSAFHGFYRSGIFRRIFKFEGIRSLAVSESVKKHLVGDLGINSNVVRVVYNGINEKEFEPTENIRNVWGLENKYLVGILGRVSQEKGHFLAVWAIKNLAVKYPDLYLLISGRGKKEKELKQLINKLNLDERVVFVNCEANQFLESIDLLLVPSQKEGFGYSVVEAFLKKVPVIGYNVGGISEIIQDQKTGFLFYNYNHKALSEVIEKVIQDKNMKEEIIKNANKQAYGFTSSKMAVNTEKVYLEVAR